MVWHVAVVLGLLAIAAAVDPETPRRQQMVTDQIAARGIRDQRVLTALRAVPRHEFVPDRLRASAYADGPLPIGFGQTISQPYIVALMTELLQLPPDAKVLEVGTGSGYQAAVLAELTDHVFTTEIIEPLATQAAERLKRLGYGNVQVRHADGFHGWKEHAPFDAIIVTAAADLVPPPLLDQLKPDGRMAIPVGGPFQQQWLVLVEKNQQGELRTRTIAAVAFVPLTRETR